LARRGISRTELLAFLAARGAERGAAPPSKATLNRWFAGSAIPNLQQALDLAAALEVRLNQLVDPDAPDEPTAGAADAESLAHRIFGYLGAEASLRRLLLLGDRDACVCAGQK
jgi:hypothetical protein